MLSNKFKGQWNAVALAMVVLLAFCFAFGGGSRAHALRLALVELAALPLLAISLTRLALSPAEARTHKFALGLLAALVALPLLQLLPLPPAVWTSVPGRDSVVLALELVAIPAGWSPLSLTPAETWSAVLALIPPVAVFVGLLLNSNGPLTRRAILLILVLALGNVAVGALQMVSGDRTFYPYDSTQTGFVSGLFANRNHFATLMLASMPLGAALVSDAMVRDPERTRLYLMLFAAGCTTVMLALLAAQSRVGILLFLPALLLSGMVAWRAAGLARPSPVVPAVVGLLITAILGLGATYLPPILDRFDGAAQNEERFQQWPIALEAGQAYLPVGAGVGSFDPVFRTVEPLEQLDGTYFNNAHNDYIEIWIETGWIGLALVALFLVWCGRRTWQAWFQSHDQDRFLRRGASVAILLILVHSIFDYPLRTEAVAVTFALAAAILEGTRTRAGVKPPSEALVS